MDPIFTELGVSSRQGRWVALLGECVAGAVVN